MDIDVKRLKTFIAVVEEQSFTAAAARLTTSQPWVSEQLRQLEEMLGVSLVERVKGKFVKLTANGRDFLGIAEGLITAWDDAHAQVEVLRTRESSRLVLGTDALTLYMPERNRLITDFMATASGLDFQILNEQPRYLFEGLHAGRYDLLLTLCPPLDTDLEVLPLYEYELKLFVPKMVADDPRFNTPDGVIGAKVLVLQDSYHPMFFPWMRNAFAPAQFEWASCPETSYHALLPYAVMLGLPTLSPDFSQQIPYLVREMEVREARLPAPVKATWGLMRTRGFRRAAADKFWKMAVRSR
jgi:DNA-binding transcriptional LysR family regulator